MRTKARFRSETPAWPGIAACGMAAVLLATPARGMHATGAPLFETESPRTWSMVLRGSMGRREGEAREVVYDEAHRLSELQWEIKGLTWAGLELAVYTAGRWTFTAGAWTALNKGNGEMRDYDWLVPGWDWTDYSRSETDVEEAWSLDFNAAYRVLSWTWGAANLVAGYQRDTLRWIDRGQEFLYSDQAFRDTPGHFGGMALIDYKQVYDIPYVGVQAESQGLARWGWQAYARYSPYVHARDWDHHILRELHFEGDFNNGTYWAAGAAVTRSLTPHWSMSAAVQAQWIPEFRGDMRIVEVDETYSRGAGIEHDSVALFVSLNWAP
jgi:plasminogen activator